MRRLIPAYIRIPVFFFIIVGIVEYFVDSGELPAFLEYTEVQLFLLLVLLILIAIEVIINALEHVMLYKLDQEAKAKFLEHKKLKTPIWIKNTYKKLQGSKPIEKEHEIILDHDYDGIKELNNDLPPWWLYSFYISIIFAVVYMAKYHILDGDTQLDEYNTQMAEAKLEIEEYKKTAKDLVDYNTVQMLEGEDLKAGENIWNQNCAVCHMADGGGGIGPNMTDDYYILGGGIKNIFKTISEGGRPGKGMEAWSKKGLRASQIAQVSSYIVTLNGTTPANPKDAEGELWENNEDQKEDEQPKGQTTIEEQIEEIN